MTSNASFKLEAAALEVRRRITRSRIIAVTALFSALAVVLRLSPIRVPAPFAPYLIFEVWEVPIVAALLLFGPRAGYGVGVVVLLVGTAVSGGPLPTGQLYNFIAFSSMMLGVIVAKAVYSRRESSIHGSVSNAFLSTALGVAARVGVMMPLMALLLPQPFPLGYSIPAAAMPATLTSISVFNAIVALYTIPLAYVIEKAVTRRAKASSWVTSAPPLI